MPHPFPRVGHLFGKSFPISRSLCRAADTLGDRNVESQLCEMCSIRVKDESDAPGVGRLMSGYVDAHLRCRMSQVGIELFSCGAAITDGFPSVSCQQCRR